MEIFNNRSALMGKAILLRFAPVFLLAFMVFSCSGKEEAKKPAGDAGPKIVEIKTAAVEARDVQRSVEVTGTLYAWDEVTVSSEISGTIEHIKADLGDRVKAGEVLAAINQREAKLNLDDALAALDTAKRSVEREKALLIDAETNFKRFDELFKEGIVSKSQHDSARTSHDVAIARLSESEARLGQAAAKADLAKKRLSDTAVRSPIAGEVRKRFVSAGEAVQDKAKLFIVVSTEDLKFRGSVAEVHVPKVAPGQTVKISLEAFSGQEFDGKLTRVSPGIDADTRTLEIEAKVPNPKNTLKPGFFARGLIMTELASGVPFAPRGSVYDFVGLKKVFIIKDGKAIEKTVKTGTEAAGFIELLEGANPGDILATTNLANLYDGAPVKAAK